MFLRVLLLQLIVKIQTYLKVFNLPNLIYPAHPTENNKGSPWFPIRQVSYSCWRRYTLLLAACIFFCSEVWKKATGKKVTATKRQMVSGKDFFEGEISFDFLTRLSSCLILLQNLPCSMLLQRSEKIGRYF